MSARELVAILWGVEAGRVRQDGRGRQAFAYDAGWRGRDDAVPLSLSLPLAAVDHGHGATEAFLWGLLPDNELVLERWGRRFHASPRSPFALLAHVGEDCAGAVQFAAPERAAALLGPGRMEVAWIEEREIAARLRALREDHAAWRAARDTGQFSLGGSQPKTALLLHDGRWGVPAGRTPTTHILKPPLPGLAGHVENEHLCLVLAREAGLAAATSEVRRFAGEIAIVVERYDRMRGKETSSPKSAGVPSILRVHQEDACQSLGIRPALKYQNDGGPSPAVIVELLRAHSSNVPEDIDAFVDALAFSWLTAGTDAHAKNFSILHGAGGRVRLAPLYDLASALPYPDFDQRQLRLAMKIGGEYRLARIGRRQWTALARELRLDPAGTVASVAALAARIITALPTVREQAAADRLEPRAVSALLGPLKSRLEECRKELRGRGAASRKSKRSCGRSRSLPGR
ncbi:MAG: serine/threonine-protein kinase [Planctomycetota bacterium]|nr:MAG: serine/threonine-protein kinase [Planctomycetota bacterium]